jgi:hypothetical protein
VKRKRSIKDHARILKSRRGEPIRLLHPGSRLEFSDAELLGQIRVSQFLGRAGDSKTLPENHRSNFC